MIGPGQASLRRRTRSRSRATEHTRMVNAAADLEERGEAVTARALAEAAHISLKHACTWLRLRETGTADSESVLSTLQYGSYSTSDNRPSVENTLSTEVPEYATASVDPPETSPSAPDGELFMPALPQVCLAASHQLLWHWKAFAWHCSLCGTTRTPAPGKESQHHEGRHP